MNAALNNVPAVDALAIIEEEARAVARSFGLGVSEEVAAALVERVLLRLHGQEKVRFAAARARRRQRDAYIRRHFNGSNYLELARESGLSPRQIRNIVDRKPKNDALDK